MPILGRPGQAAKAIHSGEAFALWSQLMLRYQNLEMTTIHQNFIHDLEFKLLVGRWITQNLQVEIKEIENKLNLYGIPLPPRPPKSINTPVNSEVIRDQFVFLQILSGLQYFLGLQVSDLRILLNDDLRAMFTRFLKRQLDAYDSMVKYGKIKGWLGNPPEYRTTQ